MPEGKNEEVKEDMKSGEVGRKKHASAFHPQFFSQHWMDEVIAEHAREGGFDNLKGKGQPLSEEALNQDLMTSILKNQNVLPDWVALQHVIKDELKGLKASREKDAHFNAAQILKNINKNIKKYNNIVPTPYLHKMVITEENFDVQYEKWM